MTNTFKKSLLIVMVCLGGVANLCAQTPIADLNFEITSSTSSVPSNYIYSSTQPPSIATQNNTKCIQITNGGGTEAPNLSQTPTAGSGKRWMAFCPAVDCDVEVTVMSNQKEFYIQNKDGKFFTHTNGKNTKDTEKVTGLKAGEWYAFCGGNSQVYIIKATFTSAVPAVAVTGVSVQPTSLELEAGNTSTLTATVTPDDASNKKVTWSSNDPAIASVSDAGVVKGESVGETKIIATTVDGGKTAECTVTVKAAAPIPVTAISLTNQTVKVGSSASITVTYTPSNANDGKQCTWTSSDNSIATVNNGTVTGIKEGTVTITATSTTNSSIKATCTVTVTAANPVPQTDLSIHEPGIYEEKSVAGGYNGTLSIFDNREYEVYFLGRDGDKNAGIFTKSGSQIGAGTDDKSLKIEWFSATSADGLDGSGREGKDEFAGATGKGNLKMKNGDEMLIHIKGFDQFTLWGKDNNTNQSKEKYFYVYIDNNEQPVQNLNSSDGGSIRRYDISSSEHVIKITSKLDGVCKPYGFSLRVSDQPRVRWIKGNDSTQTVLQTQALKSSVYYFTKYNSKGETKLEWEGSEATGITLEKAASATIGDTLVLGGVANCPVGEYKYNVVTYMNGAETSRVSGKLKVTSDIKASSDTLVDAYQGEEMEVIEFRYYALSANDVQLTWTNGTPAGISGAGEPNTNKYVISGTTSATPGKYSYSITVNGSSTVITGYIEVISQNLGENPVLYLYQTKSPKRGYDNDGVYAYLKGKDVNLQPRTTINKLRSKEQYSKFKWILISDDVNADNAEVLEIARGGADLPVLNMKGFTYTEGRLGWGEPDNGSIDTLSHNGQYIYVQQASHPIFNGFNAQTNSKIKVFDALVQNGVMPINVDYPGSFALATAYTRNIDDYYKDGEQQTIIHEIPASERNNKKYICFPLSITSSNKLSSDGKKLLNNIVDYLLGSEQASMAAPKLEMASFQIGEYKGNINQTNNTVDLAIDTDKYPDMDLKALKPIVSVADPMTHVSPASGEEVDFLYSIYMPVEYVVTDYINRRVYEVVVRASGSQGIDEVYTLGEWVNIYDIFGRKVATTNENIYTMELPKGIYIIVTEGGNTLKIMR